MKNFKRISIVLMLCVVVSTYLNMPIKASSLDEQLTKYYAVIDELNEKYNADIYMPSKEELEADGKLDSILSMSPEEFYSQIETQYKEIGVAKQMSVAASNSTNKTFLDSTVGRQNQYCYIINASGKQCGQFFLSSYVMGSGINIYTSILSYGSDAVTSSGYWFNTTSASCSLSSNNKTCTVSYHGAFKNDQNILLTSYRTYTVTYSASGGNLNIFLGVDL